MSYQLPIPGPTEPLQPYDQTAPQSARDQLAYAASDVLDLGQGLGLNPGMKGLVIPIRTAVTFDQWRSGRAPRPSRQPVPAGLVAGWTLQRRIRCSRSRWTH
jgi:hypothetical protein